jgi:hypothetical protein
MTITRRHFVVGVAAVGASVSRGQAAEPSMSDETVVELRQYTLRKGQRDTLINLFEERFLEPQNALGVHVLGTFRDLDDPDRFVWIRGFRDMATRQQSLERFYGGPIWHANREAAIATMLDSDNVLLLRPASEDYGFQGVTVAHDPSHIIGARIYYLDTTDPEQFTAFFARSLMPRLIEMGVHPIARLITHGAANNFRLPVREHDRVYVWFARWNSVKEEEDFSARWSALSGWRDDAPESVLPALMHKPERLRLSPTARSALR